MLDKAIVVIWRLKAIRILFYKLMPIIGNKLIILPLSCGLVMFRFRDIPSIINEVKEILIDKVYFKMRCFLPSNEDEVIDIGAHVGLYSLCIAKYCKKIIVIEPFHDNATILQKNLLMNKIKNFILIPFAVSNKRGKVKLYLHRSSAKHSLIIRSPKFIEGKAMTLDDIIKLLNLQPTIVKIDVEGAEAQVLEGAKKLISKGAKFIIASYHYKGEAKDLAKLLPGYSIHEVIINGDTYLYAYKMRNFHDLKFKGFRSNHS